MKRYMVIIYANGGYSHPDVASFDSFLKAFRLAKNTRLGGFGNVVCVKLVDNLIAHTLMERRSSDNDHA